MNLGGIYWITNKSSVAHPYVLFKYIEDTSECYLCAITSNTKKANIPGNVLLDSSEGNLDKQSVVEVSKVVVLQSSEVKEQIGILSQKRVAEILQGMQFIETSFLHNRL
ncbi:type II toxin-antitoxin system PemK/MazF family toxin [Candidatus Dojkabacteria bacterium]|uniref:Type II toxin-antitoxin system PemK/MazF family toxin n=1 Tax=Candidatus Dojkabacteria bacterium TaxID=2099670 RepID=A0A955RK62_9BACT|nr:type II toxin-antitoxin system PemK/MazF family toxin [Candidatus Dojkabacteria bacterium]